MASFWKSKAFRLSLGIVLTVVVVILALQMWLTSAIGRGLVETRLSAALGRPVRLEGDFNIDILPLPGATGSGLRVLSKDGQAPVLLAGDYLAQLALWPLIKGEVEIIALRAIDAGLDIGVLTSESPASGQVEDRFSGLPSIQNFELTDASVFFNGMGSEPHLQISELFLDDFKIDSQAEFRFQALVFSDEAQTADVKAAGQLRLRKEGVLDLNLSNLSVASDDWLIEDVHGRIAAELNESVLALRLEWSDDEQQAGIDTSLGWNPGYPDNQQGLVINSLNVQLDGHSITGQGCLLQNDAPQLHLELAAPTMKLGDIRLIVDKWKKPATAMVDSVDSTDELPIELAVLLVIDQASYQDTLAEGIRISAGATPDCPQSR